MNGWVLGADGSHWSGSINFAKMADAGAKYYIGKASDSARGGSYLFEDRRFTEHFDQAFGRGELLLGCFHWLQPDIDPKRAADYFLERYFRYPFHFPAVLDFEEKFTYLTGTQSHYAWCAQVWLDEVERATGRVPIVYTAKWYMDHFQDKHVGFFRKYPLWVAQYPWVVTSLTRPRVPYPWDNWKIWQYSADGNSRGAEFGMQAKSIDLNYFQGSYEDLLAWLGISAPMPPENGGDTLYVIEMLGNMNIRTTPNGSATGQYALKGEVYHSTEERNGWYRIIKNGVAGWISGLTQWTRITEIDTEPEPMPEPIEPDPEPDPGTSPDPDLTLEERVKRLEKAVFG